VRFAEQADIFFRNYLTVHYSLVHSETAIEKQNFLRNLENNLYQNTFFKLLRRNQATATSNGPEVLFKGTKSANT
jgi:hypothetical protein